MRIEHNSEQYNYIKSVFAPEDKDLCEVINSLREDEAHMQISPAEGKILQTLLRAINAKKIIELGTLGGYSSIWMARALPEDGKLYAIEMDYKKEERILKNLQKCGVSNKIELTIGKANDILPSIAENAPFDAIFIDADKSNYLNYLNWAEDNIRKGGLIIGDNSFLFGSVYGDNSKKMNPETVKTMQAFNNKLANPEKYTSILLPTTEGMTVAVKEF